MFKNIRKCLCGGVLACTAVAVWTTDAGHVAAADRPGFNFPGGRLGTSVPDDDRIWEVRYRRTGDDDWQVARFKGEDAELRATEFCERLRRERYAYRMERPAIAAISEDKGNE